MYCVFTITCIEACMHAEKKVLHHLPGAEQSEEPALSEDDPPQPFSPSELVQLLCEPLQALPEGRSIHARLCQPRHEPAWK